MPSSLSWNPPRRLGAQFDASSGHINDDVVANLRYLHARGGNTKVLTADLSGTTSSTSTNTTGLVFPLIVGALYEFRFGFVWTSSNTSTGFKCSVTFPTAAIFAATARTPRTTADGVSGEWHGWITTSDDPVISSDAPATGTPYLSTIEGIILPTANGSLQARHCAETGGLGTIVVKQGSYGLLGRLA